MGANKDSFLCDKIINSVNDERCLERLLDLQDNQLTVERVMQVCRQVELTKAHLKSIGTKDKTEAEVKNVHTGKKNQWPFAAGGSWWGIRRLQM